MHKICNLQLCIFIQINAEVLTFYKMLDKCLRN